MYTNTIWTDQTDTPNKILIWTWSFRAVVSVLYASVYLLCHLVIGMPAVVLHIAGGVTKFKRVHINTEYRDNAPVMGTGLGAWLLWVVVGNPGGDFEYKHSLLPLAVTLFGIGVLFLFQNGIRRFLTIVSNICSPF
jgi:hypothetical protein